MQVHDLCSKFKDAQFNAFMVGSSERFQESILMALSCWQVFSPSVSVCKLAARSKAWTKNCQLVILFTSGKKTSPAHIMSLRWCQPTHKKNSQWDYVGLSFQVGWELIYIYICVCVCLKPPTDHAAIDYHQHENPHQFVANLHFWKTKLEPLRVIFPFLVENLHAWWGRPTLEIANQSYPNFCWL